MHLVTSCESFWRPAHPFQLTPTQVPHKRGAVQSAPSPTRSRAKRVYSTGTKYVCASRDSSALRSSILDPSRHAAPIARHGRVRPVETVEDSRIMDTVWRTRSCLRMADTDAEQPANCERLSVPRPEARGEGGPARQADRR